MINIEIFRELFEFMQSTHGETEKASECWDKLEAVFEEKLGKDEWLKLEYYITEYSDESALEGFVDGFITAVLLLKMFL